MACLIEPVVSELYLARYVMTKFKLRNAPALKDMDPEEVTELSMESKEEEMVEESSCGKPTGEGEEETMIPS